MACSHVKLMGVGGPLPPFSIDIDQRANRAVTVAIKTRVVPLQVRRQQEQNGQVPKSLPVSRRDTMVYMTAEILCGTTLFSAKSAEARVGKLERKKRIMEKLEKLRQEAEASKPKTRDRTLPPFPMNPKQGSIVPLVEASLP